MTAGHACTDCERQWRHCHGTWLTHHEGQGHCTDDGCDTPQEGHPLSVDCRDDACP
jgi:hypothetical protein